MATIPRTAQLLAPALFVIGGTCQYLGAAIGVFLFDTLDPASVAWVRGAGAALVLLAWRRPHVRGWTRRRLLTAGMFGVVTTSMNVFFYEAIHRMPLGAAVAIEFLGPVAIAAAGSRRVRDVVALVLVVAGATAIASAQFGSGSSVVGVVWALGAAALWAGYIVLGKRVADAGSGIDDLAVGMAIAAVMLFPVLVAPEIVRDGSVFLGSRVWLLGLGVGVLSSVVPYVLDQVVLVREGRARFALMLALLPTTATVVGAVALAQLPSIPELLGIAAVVAAVVVSAVGAAPPPVSTHRLPTDDYPPMITHR